MKWKHRKTLELIFNRPVSGSIKWDDIEALFVALGAEVSEREGSRVAVVLFKEYSGKFNLRIPPELHAEIASRASADGKSLNQWVVDTLDQIVHAN